MSTVSPEWMIYVRALFALLFVIGLIFLTAALAKRLGIERRFSPGGKAKRLHFVETLYLDTRHRLIIVRAGDKEHLLLIGTQGNTVVDSWEAKEPHAV